MSDLISRQAAIDALETQERQYTFGNDEFNLEAAYHDCKMVFDGITDDDSFQEADTGLILYYANEIIYALHEILEDKDTNVHSNDCISRQAAIDAINSHFGFNIEEEYGSAVQEVINGLPSEQPEIIRCKDCKWSDWYDVDGYKYCYCIETGVSGKTADDFCSYAERETK